MSPTGETDLDLPKALVKRLVKSALASGDDGKDVQLNKDALAAFSESAKVFINYLSSTANEICKETKRSTISAEDVFQALEDIEFTDFVTPLRELLEAYKRETKEKKERKVVQSRKRKGPSTTGAEAGTSGGVDEDDASAGRGNAAVHPAQQAAEERGDVDEEGSDDLGGGEGGDIGNGAARDATGAGEGGGGLGALECGGN